jgi:hypothetical protein
MRTLCIYLRIALIRAEKGINFYLRYTEQRHEK